jgi:transposase
MHSNAFVIADKALRRPVRQKLEVVEYTKSNSVRRAAQHFNINRTSIIRWPRQVESLRNQSGGTASFADFSIVFAHFCAAE